MIEHIKIICALFFLPSAIFIFTMYVSEENKENDTQSTAY